MKKWSQVQCNMCQKSFTIDKGLPMHDLVHVEKTWGYFSDKDGETHSFHLCEECYDKLVKQFQIPVKVKKVKELI